MRRPIALVSFCLFAGFVVHEALRAADPVTDPAVDKKEEAAYLKNCFANRKDVPGMPRVLIIGDSISIAYTIPVRKVLLDQANVYRANGNCMHTAHGLGAISSWLGKEKWDIIHFNWGIWDTSVIDKTSGELVTDESRADLKNVQIRLTAEEYKENLVKLVKILKGTGAKLIWASTTPVMSRQGDRAKVIEQYNEIAAAIMKMNGVEIDDLHGLVFPEITKWQSMDKCHFSTAGSQKLGEQVAKSILAELKGKQKPATSTAQPDRQSACPPAPGPAAALVEKAKGPLAGQPSQPGPHLMKIKALGGNAWMNLGKPAADPRYGAAQGRSWSRKMAFAPDLRGAFLFGSGIHHGSTLRNGRKYYNDDIYFYDIHANSWVCAYPGTPGSGDGNAFTFDPAEIKLDPATKLNTDKNGNIVPVATSVHSYWTPEYDTDRKRFMFVPSFDSYGFLGNAQVSNGMSGEYSPYYYDGRTGAFERRKAAAGFPRCNFDTALFYSQKLKKPVYFNEGVWLYDHDANSWKKVSAEGGGNAAYCHDTKHDLVYVVRGQRKKNEKGEWVSAGPNLLSVYDIGANKWSKPETTGDSGELASSNTAFFTYDTVNGVAVLHVEGRIHVYDSQTRKWTAMPQTFPEKLWDPKTRQGVEWNSSSGFYDPEANAHFYFNAADSSTAPGNMWVYRYAQGR